MFPKRSHGDGRKTSNPTPDTGRSPSSRFDPSASASKLAGESWRKSESSSLRPTLSIQESLRRSRIEEVELKLRGCREIEAKVALWNSESIYDAKEASRLLKVIKDAKKMKAAEIQELSQTMGDFYHIEQDIFEGAPKVDDIMQKITSSRRRE